MPPRGTPNPVRAVEFADGNAHLADRGGREWCGVEHAHLGLAAGADEVTVHVRDLGRYGRMAPALTHYPVRESAASGRHPRSVGDYSARGRATRLELDVAGAAQDSPGRLETVSIFTPAANRGRFIA